MKNLSGLFVLNPYLKSDSINFLILFSDFEIDPDSLFNLTLEYIDAIVIIFFTIEYSIRFICAPRKWRFFKVIYFIMFLLYVIKSPLHTLYICVSFIPFFVFGHFWWWSCENTKILCNLCLHFARQDGLDEERKSRN